MPRMSTIALLCSTLLTGLLIGACRTTPTDPPSTADAPDAAPPRDEPKLPAVGSVAPPLSLTTADGVTVTLDEARAKGPVVLVFGSFT